MTAAHVRPVPVTTLGCRLNFVESEAMERLARDATAPVAVVNTCAVTADSQRKSMAAVRRALRDAPEAAVAVTGCAAEIAPAAFAGLSDRVRLIPNARKTDRSAWGSLLRAPADATGHTPPLQSGKTRGFVAVQNGCDHRCTFCTIPFGRGPSRSVPLETVTAAVKALSDAGHADVALTGVDLTAWGQDLPGGFRLGDLVRAILRAVPALPRLRLSSLDCIEADPVLLDVVGAEPRLMPHLHLSLQAGDDIVLKRMKRRHGRDDARRFCDGLRRRRADLVFGADLIAGFPTETEGMFANTRALVADCDLTFLHVFPYSPRPGTPAARMPPVPPAIVAERAALLREDGATQLRAHLARQVGRRLTVLAERGGTGRAADFTPVRVPAEARPGTLADLPIAGHDGTTLIAGACSA